MIFFFLLASIQICRYLHTYDRLTAFFYRQSSQLDRQQGYELGTAFLENLNKT